MLDTKERCSDLHCSNFQADSDTVPAGGRTQAINKLIISAAKAGAAGQRSQGSKWEKLFQEVGTKTHLCLGQNQLFETNYIKLRLAKSLEMIFLAFSSPVELCF